MVGIEALQDLTDLITKRKYEDDSTIADKFDPKLLETMTIDGKIYGLPHYELYDGPSYDVSVFEENALFFIEEMDTADTKYPGTKKFMASKTHAATRSCGPDGVLGTYDDGLPSTVQEFYKLLERMEQKTVKPFIWTGDSPHYSNQILRRLFANLGGAGLLNANYYLDSRGEKVEIVTGFDKNGAPILDEVVITRENGYLLRQASALYYVLEFAQKVRSNDKFIEDDGLALDHISTQEAFVNSGKNFNGNDPVAMIIDGSWWWNEANDDGIFERFSDYPDSAQKEFKVMPLPVKYAGTVKVGEGKAPVVQNGVSAFTLVNKNIEPSKVKAMEEFLYFLYSQDELLEFTKITNGVLRGLNYNYSTIYSSLNSFAQSSLEIVEAAKEAGTYIMTYSSDETYLKYKAAFGISNNDWLSGKNVRFPIHEYTTKTTLQNVRDQFNSFKIDPSTWQK
jgi:ABC-type glycerol-3-phosphate transport system substrate-binding protein